MADTKKSAEKTRVSYGKEVRDAAKARGEGLITISITMPNGERVEHQAGADPKSCMFAKWAAAILFCPDVKQLPDLENLIRNLMENP